jgi:thioredoxin 1
MAVDHIIMETRDNLKKYLSETTSETTIIKFTATWCRPCRMIEPVIHQLNNEYEKRGVNYEYIELDVDHATDIYALFKRMKMANGIPTLLCFKKSHYSESSWYVPYKAITGADQDLVIQFFQLCLGK